MTTFILVPGGWRGGWYFQPIAESLRSQGHSAFPVTLTGLGDRAHLRTAATNLDTHIEDVVSLVEAEEIHDAVLVGHSYAGMVIAGAASRLPDRIRRLVYCDAYVPADGESCFDLTTSGFRELFIQGARVDGHSVLPPPGPETRTTPHPLASFLQQIQLDTPPQAQRKDYIYLDGWSGTPFTDVYQRLCRDPDWHVHTLPIGHDVVADAPEALVQILLAE
ncbi:alpha/beta fold hydrolase [Nocardia sp. NPDC051321]|uniref:alpha/beta fold hydrolase n=1 Tax=Nocardia sp. NPDC051321 TaxID=3364323 RepID=UPI0037A19F42